MEAPTMQEGHVTYTSENLTEAVLGRIAADASPRMRQVMTALITHLHAFVREVELTPAEWEQGVALVTELGQWCDDKRQEVILLSDILGVSMLVDAIAHRDHASVSETTVLGPFHREDPPRMANGQDLSPGAAGETLEVAIRVLDDHGAPLDGAQVDVWHTSAEGFYDSQLGDEHAMRGRFTTGPDGVVAFPTVMPGSYPVPNDGPVGRVLDAMGRGAMRPAHMHFWIKKPGYRDLITHIFKDGDPHLHEDAVFGVKASLVTDWEAPRRAGQPAALRYDFRIPKLEEA